MKFFVPLLAFATLALTACSTDANRRDLYSPKKADGYWTRSLEEGTYKDREVVDAQLPGGREGAGTERTSGEPTSPVRPRVPSSVQAH